MAKNKSRLKSRLFNFWEPPDFSQLFEKIIKRAPHTLKKGTVIINETSPLEHIHYIKSGFVKLYRLSEEGKDATSYLLGPNYILGVRSLTSFEKQARHTAEAITDVEIITISYREYYEAILDHPEFLIDLMQVFKSRLSYTEKKLEGFMFGDSTARVANFLYDSATRFGKKRNGKIYLPITLTHQKIAEFVGCTRETVTLALNRLQKEKTVIDKKGEITILDIKKLYKFARSKKQ